MTAPLSIRGPAALGLVALALLVLGFGLWSVLTRIDGAVIASGRIEVQQDRQVVQHIDGGTVAEIFVSEGATVAAGELILRLDGAALQSEQAIVDGKLAELAARSARLLAERDDLPALVISPDLVAEAARNPDTAARIEGERRLFEARAATLIDRHRLLSQRILQFQAQTGGIAAQEVALASQLALIDQELQDQQMLLDKGLAEAGRVRALRREQARLEGEIGQLAAARAEAEGQITATEIEIAGLSSLRREAAAAELRDIGPQILELSERRRALAERIARLEVRAPVSGIVLGLQVTTPRAVLRAAEPILTLVPQDRPLVITARIAPINIDEVQPGQTADLVFPAFSARDLPLVTGHVVRVSADALTDPQTGQSFYTVELELADTARAPLGDRALLPGMPVEVYLRTGSHTPLAYLVKPFADYFHRAFRES